MEFRQTGERLSGSAALARLTEPGAEALTLAGTQQADTLDISFARNGVPSFRFLGWYVSNRTQIAGTLTGAEFTDVGVLFRKQCHHRFEIAHNRRLKLHTRSLAWAG